MKRTSEGSTFSSSEASRISGVPYRNVYYWERTGLVEPFVPSSGSGKGKEARYNCEDIVVLTAMAMMTAALRNFFAILANMSISQT